MKNTYLVFLFILLSIILSAQEKIINYGLHQKLRWIYTEIDEWQKVPEISVLIDKHEFLAGPILSKGNMYSRIHYLKSSNNNGIKGFNAAYRYYPNQINKVSDLFAEINTSYTYYNIKNYNIGDGNTPFLTLTDNVFCLVAGGGLSVKFLKRFCFSQYFGFGTSLYKLKTQDTSGNYVNVFWREISNPNRIAFFYHTGFGIYLWQIKK